MPSLPPGLLREWLQPGAVVAGLVGGLGLLMSAFRGLEARLNQRISELREDLRASEARLREEIKASADRQREESREVKAEVKAELKAMGEKLDRVLESLLAVKS